MDEESLTVKLTDFGLLREIDSEPGQGFEFTYCGTVSYIAPEIFTESVRREYAMQVDVWSAGVVLYLCLCGFPPFSEELCTEEFPHTMDQQIEQGIFSYPSPWWDSIGDPAVDLVDSMLVVDPEKRFTVKKCLDHAWMLDTPVSILPDVIRSASPVDVGGEST
ncbi:hypothetical protein FQN49_000588 [Arthroderma sp. PD_2]|nr:hypothetical protein FQN49_000588 [Arthroderma sp. PD_2]